MFSLKSIIFFDYAANIFLYFFYCKKFYFIQKTNLQES